MNYKAISVDLAKNVFQVCGIDKRIKPIFNQKIRRNQLETFMAQQSPTTVYMEACYSSNYWGRVFQQLGHEVKLIPAQHVTPFVRGNKNDHNDALAIIEASQRPHIKFVPVKSEHQQEISCLHRIRERLIKNKTAISNQTRGLLSEFGIALKLGKTSFVNGLYEVIDSDKYSSQLKKMMSNQLTEYLALQTKITEIDKELKSSVNTSPNGRLLLSIPGIGVIIASAILATIDKGQAFNNPREFSVWLGLTPRQYASGNNSKMGKITKRGNCYLRKQLIHGARTVVNNAKNKNDQLSQWINNLRNRKSYNQTAVATAHRLARLLWILLQRQESYSPQAVIAE